jgi:hypothetical protein
MEGIEEVNEEDLSSSEEVIIEEVSVEEEIEVIDGESSYEEEEIEEETIDESEGEFLEEEETEVLGALELVVSDQVVHFVGKIPPHTEVDTDGWKNHFQNQHEHIFDDSDTLLASYDESTLENVYDMTISAEDMLVAVEEQTNQKGSSAEQTEYNYLDDDNNVMRRLSKKRQEEKRKQADESLTMHSGMKQKKHYSKRKYKPRGDPFMGELQETVSTWFRFEGGTENDNQIDDKEDETKRRISEEGETREIEKTNLLPSPPALSDPDVGHDVEVEDPGVETDEIGDKDDKDHIHSGPNEKPSDDESPSKLEGKESTKELGNKNGFAKTSSGFIETVHSEESKPKPIFEESDIESRTTEEGKENDKAAIHQYQRAAPACVPSNPAEPSPPVAINKSSETKKFEDRDVIARKLDNTDTSSSGSSDDDDSSISSVQISAMKSRAPNRSISIENPENHELVNKVLDESQETALDLEEIIRSVPESPQSPGSAGLMHGLNNVEENEARVSVFQREYGSGESSFLHKLIHERDWNGLERCVKMLKQEGPFTIQQELTRVEVKNSTPLHEAVSLAPAESTSLLISLVPFDFREDVLMSVDDNGNTPLHVACEHFNVPWENKAFAHNIKILSLGCPRVHFMRNYAGETPLSLLLASPGSKPSTDGNLNDWSDNVASDLVRSILKQNPTLINDRSEDSSTFLHTASANCVHDGVLRALIEADDGASLSRSKDQHGMLPLHVIVSCTNGKISSAKSVRRLVKAYPEGIVQVSSTGDTPLHLFVSNVSSWIDNKEEVKTTNTSKLVQILLGNGDVQSPLLVRNGNGVSLGEMSSRSLRNLKFTTSFRCFLYTVV